jgi:hypothetical protein
VASQGLDALAETDQAVAGAGKGCLQPGGAIVLDADVEASLGLVDADLDADVGTGRVPERVGEALLHDAEGQVGDRSGDVVAVALEATGDVQSAAPRARDHLVEEREVGRRDIDSAAEEPIRAAAREGARRCGPHSPRRRC